MKIPGIKSTDLAAELGIGVSTVYNWKEVPASVAAYLKLRAEVRSLREENAVLRGVVDKSYESLSETLSLLRRHHE